MIVGGPNARKDYHYNETEELFYQLEGDINVRIQEEGKAVDISIKEGEMVFVARQNSALAYAIGRIGWFGHRTRTKRNGHARWLIVVLR